MKIEQCFIDEARRQLLAEEEARFMSLVRERATRLQGEHQRVTSTDFPTAGPELMAKIIELEAREKELTEARQRAYPGCLSAADDFELDNIGRRIFEMKKRARQLGLMPPEQPANPWPHESAA
jgi:hypothetical protein